MGKSIIKYYAFDEDSFPNNVKENILQEKRKSSSIAKISWLERFFSTVVKFLSSLMLLQGFAESYYYIVLYFSKALMFPQTLEIFGLVIGIDLFRLVVTFICTVLSCRYPLKKCWRLPSGSLFRAMGLVCFSGLIWIILPPVTKAIYF